ncbi:Trafficking protein particle complex subunit [Entamoeba marina]
MKQTFTAQSSFDYLLMQIVKSRQRTNATLEESTEQMKRIGYDVGLRLSERFSSTDKAITRLDDAIKYMTFSPWCSPFFQSAKIEYIESTKTHSIAVVRSPFISNVSTFESTADALNETTTLYLSYLVGLVLGVTKTLGFNVNVTYALQRSESKNPFELRVTLCD